MKKIISIVFLVSLLICSMAAAAPSSYVVDKAKLLRPDEVKKLEARVREVKAKYDFDLVIVTTSESMQGKKPVVFTADYYMDNGYGAGETRDGLIFLINMKERDWAVVGTGLGKRVFNGAVTRKIGDQCKSNLSKGRFNAAFNEFIDLSTELLAANKKGDIYGSFFNPYLTEDDYDVLYVLTAIFGLISFGISFAVIKPKGMKTVKLQKAAMDYAANIKLLRRQDTYLRSSVSSTRKASQSSSGGGSSYSSDSFSSSSGSSHSGSSGKF